MGNDMRNEANGEQNTNTQTIEFEVNYRWTERNVLISPRHRVPRDVQRDGCSRVSVKSVTGSEAPVAFQAPESAYVRGDLITVGRDYRIHGDRIWTQLLTGERGVDAAPIIATPEWFAGRVSGWSVGGDARTAALNAGKDFSNYLVVDGTVWIRSREPQYETMTFGMGGNHGATSLDITTRYDENKADEHYYAADEFDLALESAVIVAEKRGDNESVARIKATQPILVLINSAVGTTVKRPSRLTYVRPYDLTVQSFRAELASFRAQITWEAEASTFFDGATAYDYSKLTSTQVSDYKAYIAFGAYHGLI